jgi:uncharacterized membrane protein
MNLIDINLIIHFFGFGLFVTLMISGVILERKYRKAPDVQTKAAMLGVMRSFGLLSPVGVLIMIVTGIVNMYELGIGLFDYGWLTAKIIFFAIAATNGVIGGIRGKRRGMLVMQMAKGKNPPDAERQIAGYDAQQRWFFVVNGILLVLIVYLSVSRPVGEM